MLSAVSSALAGIVITFSWAFTVAFDWGLVQVNDRNANENPKIAPNRTKLNTNRFFDESFFSKSIIQAYSFLKGKFQKVSIN
jgi:hypothetical protein